MISLDVKKTLPWILFLMLMAFLAVVQFSPRSHDEAYFPVVLWGLIALGMDLALGLSARRRLLEQFREVAAGGLESGRAKVPIG